MRISTLAIPALALAGGVVLAVAGRSSASEPSPPDELGFRQLRERFHLATSSGDRELLHSLWADDARFIAGGNVYEGPDEITSFLADTPAFGHILSLTSESKSRIVMHGNQAEYAFECIIVDMGDLDPLYTSLAQPQGQQNPGVMVARHTNSQGIAARDAAGRWVFVEFNGGAGPLPPEAPEPAPASSSRNGRGR